MRLSHLAHRTRHYFTLNNGVLLIAGLITLSWLWGTVTTLQKNFQLEQQLAVLDADIELAELESANAEFQQQYYRSDEYLELAARDRLNKAAPGEKLVLLPPSPHSEDEITTEPIIQEPANFQQWMQFFFGRKNG